MGSVAVPSRYWHSLWSSMTSFTLLHQIVQLLPFISSVRQYKSVNDQSKETRSFHLGELILSQVTWTAKRTHHQCQGMLGTPGRVRRSRRAHQNSSTNTWNKGRMKAHQVDLERGQTTRAVKRPYKAVFTMSRNALEALGSSVLMEQMHQVQIECQVGI